ncbi:unnamed protein product [Sphagnum jensenii]|uniref:Uncharacterized protein n=1 Tax=Sphagnum jensenii TaxID=128206 RepID=A0ABP0XKZ9_9BRYO
MVGPQVHGRLVELGGRGCWHGRLAKLHGRLEERCERGQPHGRLAEVHGGLAKLSGRGRLHRHLAELGGRGRSHCRLVEPNGRGKPHSHLAEPGMEDWQGCSPTEEGDRTTIWKNGKRGAGLQPKPARSPGAKTFTGRTKFSLKDGSSI